MAERTGRRIRGLDADQRRAQRRDDLLAAALDLFADAGYPNTSIEQLCQAAFVGTKGFYEIFDTKEACYLALLRQVSATIEARMVAVLRTLPADEPAATELLLSTFAHALVDDPRFARVTFGQAGGISAAVERQRRVNRRWAADFLTSVWQRDGTPADPSLHRVAIGVVGGLFDLVADWMLDPGEPDSLIADLTVFYLAVLRGLPA
ncbi:MAG TPA: TetR family transcriptional regulator [Pseudonocardiaceae bacterium]